MPFRSRSTSAIHLVIVAISLSLIDRGTVVLEAAIAVSDALSELRLTCLDFSVPSSAPARISTCQSMCSRRRACTNRCRARDEGFLLHVDAPRVWRPGRVVRSTCSDSRPGRGSTGPCMRRRSRPQRTSPANTYFAPAPACGGRRWGSAQTSTCAASKISMVTSASCTGSCDHTHSDGVVPAHSGLVAEGDILDVDEDLVLALLVPDLMARVPRIRRGSPGLRTSPTLGHSFGGVAGRVCPLGERMSSPCKIPLRCCESRAFEELGEDPLHDWCRNRVLHERVQASAHCGVRAFVRGLGKTHVG